MRLNLVTGYFVIFTLLFELQCRSQEVICSAGDVFSNSSVQTEWSLGEVAIDTYYDDEIVLSQGFHQPVILKQTETDFEIKVYPNPYDLNLFIEISQLESEHMYARIFDISGKLIFNKPDLLNFNKIITSEMSDGIYLLRIYDSQSHVLKTVKIVKLFQP
ncbi:MAG: T9SS type A sorting domain-containing protein [Bacteroidales bacterium]|nr:T9SS type A sorting domain-containing protein [Bacteroidales bacterium]